MPWSAPARLWPSQARRAEAALWGGLCGIKRCGTDCAFTTETRQEHGDGAVRQRTSASCRASERAYATALEFTHPCGSGPPSLLAAQMYERTLSEYAISAAFDHRIRQVERWLAARPESCVVLVAHGREASLLFEPALLPWQWTSVTPCFRTVCRAVQAYGRPTPA